LAYTRARPLRRRSAAHCLGRGLSVSTHFTRTVVLEQGNTGWYKIQSIFAWARMWGAPIPLAYALQGIATVALGAALVRLWRSAAPYPLQAAALCLATILATPYSFDYDMMVLAPAIAFVAIDGIMRGFSPWEKTLLAALWLMPLAARSVALVTLVPLGGTGHARCICPDIAAQRDCCGADDVLND
jgi:alpha-1,2-mannosyltransferase